MQNIRNSKVKIQDKTTEELFEIIKKRDEYLESFVNDVRNELINRNENIKLLKFDEQYFVDFNKKKSQLKIKIQKDNEGNKVVKNFLKKLFVFIFMIFNYGIFSRSARNQGSPLEKLQISLGFGLILIILFFVISKLFYSDKKMK